MPRRRYELGVLWTYLIALRASLIHQVCSPLQALRCVAQMTAASIGASLGSLVQPGLGTSLGLIVLDMAALAAMTPLVDLITGQV